MPTTIQRNPRGRAEPKSTLARAALIVSVAGMMLAAAGCQETRTTGFHRPPPRKPRPIRPAPVDARVNAVVLNLSAAPMDTNGNGYPDLIHATAHLFDTRYPPAIREDGAFVFLLYAGGDVGRPGAEPIRQWRIAGTQLQQALSRSAFGLSYQFKLSLLDGGTDVLPVSSADIVCRFEPTDRRDPVFAGEVSSIQLGRRVLIPQQMSREQVQPPPAAGQ